MSRFVSLGEYQDAFAAALLDRDDAGLLDALTAQRGFRVYRNTVVKGSSDALAANFPAIVSIVGDEWFRAAARTYARAHPPTAPMLIGYGATFPDFLAAFPPARELPYLADVARLDRLWLESHVAADAAPLDAAQLTALAPERLARVRLRLHPATRWHRSADAPIFSIWRANRDLADGTEPDVDVRERLATLDWRAEGALLVRPDGVVEAHAVGRAACAFLDACAGGATAADALIAASHADASALLDDVAAQLIGSGAFSGLDEGEGR